MSKRVKRLRIFAGYLLVTALAVCLMAGGGHAAQRGGQKTPTIAVFPFFMNLSPEAQASQEDFAEILEKRISGKGLRVIPVSKVRSMLAARNVTTLDLQTVRSLGASLGATHAVYGNLSQLGDTLSADARFVPIGGNQDAKPIFTEQRFGSSLAPAAEEIAAYVSRQFMHKESVEGVEVRGTKVLDPEVVLMRINTRKGDMLDPVEIDREIKQIWELGYFSDVRVDVEHRPGGAVVVYTVQEKPRVESVVVDGNSAVDTEDILSVMGTKSGSILNEKLLAEDIQKIIEVYRKKGYYLAKIDQSFESRQGGAATQVTLKIDEGKKLYISKITIEGANQLSESDVRSEMLLTERGMFSWITGSGVLKEELIERDSAAISSYYLNNGFLDITVGAARTEYTEDGIEVIFPISEGERYRLGTVAFEGDLIEPEDNLLKLIKLDDLAADNAYFNLSVMQEDSKKLAEFYSNYGYAYVDVLPRPEKRTGDESIVDVIFAIDKQNKVYVRTVQVEGNNKTRDNVILREMRLSDGDEFVGSKLRRSGDRLNKLGYFEMAEIELVPTEQPDEVDLKVKVQEKPTGALIGGFGYSTFSQFGVSGTIMERNLWGKGYNVAFQAGFSGRRNAYTFSFTNPRWDDTDLTVGVDMYHLRDDYIDYRKKTTGGTLRFAYPLGEYTSFGWGYRLDQYKVYDLDEDVSNLIRDYADHTRYSSVGLLRIIRDSTNRERPTSGNIDKIGFEYGGGILGGDDKFITVSGEHQTYYQLFENHILHARVKGSAIFTNGSSKVPVFERFWMGGIDSVRGYNSRDIVPRDPKTGDRIGGTRMAFANMEYIWTFAEDIGLNFVPFFDIGMNVDADRSYRFSDEIFKSVGAELRWRSPMGDLRFSYGIPLDDDRRGHRSSGRFEFSMGQFF